MKKTQEKPWSEQDEREAKDAEHLAGMATESKTVQIVIPPIDIRTVEFTIEGDTPLIVHAFGEKARKQIRDKQAKKASPGREKRDPEAEYEASLYRLPDGRPAAPTIWFKCAMVSAATSLGRTITKTAIRQAFHVMGVLVPIDGTKPRMREDVVRLAGISRPVDLRYRAEFPEGWRITLKFRYNAAAISPEQIAHLLNLAGFAVGAGEWRSEHDGVMGAYHVVATTPRKLEAVQ